MRESGFSLVEVLVAAAILVTVLASLAQLMAQGARSNAATRDMTTAAILAAQKVEELRSTAWSVDETGAPIGEPPPPGVEYLDRWGNVLGAGSPPDGSIYVRRWSVGPLPSNPALAVVFHVRVARVGSGLADDARRPNEAWILAARTRQAR